MLEETTGGAVDPDAPLLEAGIDSLASVVFGSQLAARLGVQLPGSLVFDYPPASEMGTFLATIVPATNDGPQAAVRSGVCKY